MKMSKKFILFYYCCSTESHRLIDKLPEERHHRILFIFNQMFQRARLLFHVQTLIWTHNHHRLCIDVDYGLLDELIPSEKIKNNN